MRIAIINGPNLNLLGKREPHIYGNLSFDEYLKQLKDRFKDIDIIYYQSNHEGDLIDYIQKEGFYANGIVLNAAAYTHTSIAIRDAIAAIDAPVVEVHISDIKNREPFRQVSIIEDVCCKTIIGRGLDGYKDAIQFLITK